MRTIEAACALIVALYVVLRLRRADNPRATASRLAMLACAGWIGEDSVIRAYGFYSYSAEWSVFLDRVPLMIVLIWPIVIDSAGELARSMSRRAWLVGAAIVLADASLIEPIAVHAKLWSWTEPGLFAVPPIGVLGWAFFAGAALKWERFTIVAAPLATHALLLACWWGAFRWTNGPVPAWGAVAGVWLFMAILVSRVPRVPFATLAMRAPGAAFFFVLLVLVGSDDRALVAWSLAFAVPYVALVVRSDALSRGRAASVAR